MWFMVRGDRVLDLEEVPRLRIDLRHESQPSRSMLGNCAVPAIPLRRGLHAREQKAWFRSLSRVQRRARRNSEARRRLASSSRSGGLRGLDSNSTPTATDHKLSPGVYSRIGSTSWTFLPKLALTVPAAPRHKSSTPPLHTTLQAC